MSDTPRPPRETTIWTDPVSGYSALIREPINWLEPDAKPELIAVDRSISHLISSAHELGFSTPTLQEYGRTVSQYDIPTFMSHTEAMSGIRLTQLADLRAMARTPEELAIVDDVKATLMGNPNVAEAKSKKGPEDPPEATAEPTEPTPGGPTPDSVALGEINEDPLAEAVDTTPPVPGEAPDPNKPLDRADYQEVYENAGEKLIQEALANPKDEYAQAKLAGGIAMKNMPTAGYAVHSGTARKGRSATPPAKSSELSAAQKATADRNKGRTLRRGR